MATTNRNHSPAEGVLEIDLPAYTGGNETTRRAICDGVARSLETGFVYVRHGLSETMLDDVYGKLETFFALPVETKAQLTVPGSNGSRGYTGLLVETAAGANRADWKEMLNWGAHVDTGHPLRHAWPEHYMDPVFPDDAVPGIGAALTSFHDTVIDLQRRVLHVIAGVLGVAEDYFDRFTDGGTHLTRAIHYPKMDLAPDAEHVWAGAHVDIDLVTALPRATGRGLQLRKGGEWFDVTPPDGCAIINTGIMLEHLTNGLIQAGWHRVVADTGNLGDGGGGDRYSIVQFCHPNPAAMLAPLPTCVSTERPLAYPTLSAASALDQVLWEIKMAGNG